MSNSQSAAVLRCGKSMQTPRYYSLFTGTKNVKSFPPETKYSGGHLLTNSVPRGQTVPRGNLDTSKDEGK